MTTTEAKRAFDSAMLDHAVRECRRTPQERQEIKDLIEANTALIVKRERAKRDLKLPEDRRDWDPWTQADEAELDRVSARIDVLDPYIHIPDEAVMQGHVPGA